MSDRYDIMALGECLVDMVCTEQGGKLCLEGNLGGAPANVLAMAARLGRKTAMVSKVGRDGFGDFLCRHIEAARVDTRYISRDEAHPTTLAIVRLDAAGNRSFSFYRDRTADVMLDRADIPAQATGGTRILHFGSLSLVCEPVCSATLEAVAAARAAGVTISYDPNWRPPLWNSREAAREMMGRGMELADLVKVSEEELVFLTGETDLDRGVQALLERYPMRLLAVTRGPAGCLLCTRAVRISAPTFDTECVDTTGAGDAFWGATLAWLLEQDLRPEQLDETTARQLVDFANAAGSWWTLPTRPAAWPPPARAPSRRCPPASRSRRASARCPIWHKPSPRSPAAADTTKGRRTETWRSFR